MDFSVKLREFRKNRKWSQKELGERIGVSQVQIADYERGKNLPSTETLIKIAKVFNVSIDYMVGISVEKGNFNEEELTTDPDLLRITNKMRPKLDGIPVSDEQWELINDFLESVLKREKKRLLYKNKEA